MTATFLKDPIGWWAALGRPFLRLPRWGALGVLLALALSVGYIGYATSQLAVTEAARVAARPKDRIGDVELYRRIHARVADGESYYVAALDEQRNHSYPTTPFVTVRLPTLAYLNAGLGDLGGKIFSGLLFVAGLGLFLRRLEQAGLSLAERAGAALFMLLGGITLFRDTGMRFHEVPAGMLLTLALALVGFGARPTRWWPALLCAALALAIREMALPFIMLWALFAASERNWVGVASALGVVALFAVGMMFHAQAVAAQVLPTDMPSPGWDALNGPRLPFFALAKLTPLLVIKPVWLAAALAVLPLIGWLGLGGRLGIYASAWFVGYFLFMALFARTNNNYWVLLLLPAYGMGFALVPRALKELVTVAVGGTKSLS